jgi:hypothetical protein
MSEPKKGQLNTAITSRFGMKAGEARAFWLGPPLLQYPDFYHPVLTSHSSPEVVLVVMQGLPETLVLHFVLQAGKIAGLVDVVMMFAIAP